jgi:hypothetical protein
LTLVMATCSSVTIPITYSLRPDLASSELIMAGDGDLHQHGVCCERLTNAQH